jgi:hypothetical protein
VGTRPKAYRRRGTCAQKTNRCEQHAFPTPALSAELAASSSESPRKRQIKRSAAENCHGSQVWPAVQKPGHENGRAPRGSTRPARGLTLLRVVSRPPLLDDSAVIVATADQCFASRRWERSEWSTAWRETAALTERSALATGADDGALWRVEFVSGPVSSGSAVVRGGGGLRGSASQLHRP